MESYYLLSVLTFFVQVDQDIAESCYTKDSLFSSGYYTYCYHGCCGYIYDRECCEFSLAAGAIVGIVVGSLTALGLTISLIVCIFCVCCRKSGGQAGTIVQPSQNVTMVSTTNQAGESYQSYPQYNYPTSVDGQGVIQSNTNFAPQPPPPYREPY